MKVVDVKNEKLQEVEFLGHYGVFTEFRVHKDTIPKGVYHYELRHGDNDSYPASLEEEVSVNYFGTVFMTEKLQLGEKGYLELEYEDFGYTGAYMSMLEFQANYDKEPECFKHALELVQFMREYEEPFELTELEAEKLIHYMAAYGRLLAQKEGKLFRGEIVDGQELEKVHEDSDTDNKKSRYESLLEDYSLLDALYDRTKHGKEIEVLAEKFANELIEAAMSKDGLEGAMKVIKEKLHKDEDLLPDVSSLGKKGDRTAR